MQFPKLLKLAVRYPEDSSNSTQLIHYIINMKSSHVQCKALVWEATLTKQWREYVYFPETWPLQDAWFRCTLGCCSDPNQHTAIIYICYLQPS